MDIQNIDFGYACISSIIKNCTTASTVPLGKFKKIKDKESRIYRLEKVARKNLTNTIRLLWHNIAEGIKLYRFSSQLIPLGNHPLGQIWDFTETLNEELSKIGNIVKKNGLKVSTHPGQYTVINTKHEEKFQNAIRDLKYHDRVLTSMGLDENAVMVVHVGGVYGDKEKSLKRFITNFKRLPDSVQKRIVVENDDTNYTIKDVLTICQEINRPMVLDVHHHAYNNQGENLKDYLEDIFSTWDRLDRPPKIHFSSPESKNAPLKHADYINPEEFLNFYKIAREYKFDVMVEAKKQDGAVLKLWEDLGITYK
ncbi:UV DNA damage repair endonuclease UvsE [Halothermothrix orenii]|uniref:UV-damage endonuclease n=1 Tax=Halothermothrix orenii (strain H 168 / OCM 544 / DSM 9562) TaxID=373903 RepID=B8CWQ6_HALOH|nr:UV DNA damage repair endonuclease UvsE [Halothermothrix orenii]ACL69725.1 UV-damage endonuclease [Halothermothrix orenii H 168]